MTAKLTGDQEGMPDYVVSVNGKRGVVQLTAHDVDALPDTTVIPTKTSQLENDTGLMNSDELDIKLEDKQDKLTAGDNVRISGNTISVEVGGGEIYDDSELRGKIQMNAVAIEKNGDAIQEETIARIQGDSAVQTNIDNEADVRTAADTEIEGKITAEQTAREEADADIRAGMLKMQMTQTDPGVDSPLADGVIVGVYQ